MIRRLAGAAVLVLSAACQPKASKSYLYLWAGDSTEKASDFLAVIDATPSSAKYGTVVASIPTGVAGSHPHHTEPEMPADGHLLANGFHAGRSWLFDLTQPLSPRIITSFGDVAGYSHPHTYVRLADGTLLATFQYAADSMAAMPAAGHGGMSLGGVHSTGALVTMDENGNVIRVGIARDTTISDRRIYPYSVLPMPAFDRAVSTTTDMDEADSASSAEWIQYWRLSDLTLLQTVALKPGPRGDENKFTGEPRLLPDGKSVYIHTFNCGLYLVQGIDGAAPTAKFVMAFEGKNCGVPILAGHFWLQPVPEAHALVAMDISDPEHPREVSRVKVGDDEAPHWLAIDPTGRRLVMNSGGYAKGNRLFVINLDPATGHLSLDDKFRDPGSTNPGINLSGRSWPHGFTGTASPHGTVFSH